MLRNGEVVTDNLESGKHAREEKFVASPLGLHV
jgi:hypothetical protein